MLVNSCPIYLRPSVFTLLFVCLSFNQSHSAESNSQANISQNTGISISSGRKYGALTYEIGGTFVDGKGSSVGNFRISELSFPINVNIHQIHVNIPIRKQWNFNTHYGFNSERHSDNIEDRDWGILYLQNPNSGFKPNSLDVYSEAENQISISEWNAQFHKVKSFTDYHFKTFSGFGFLYQNYAFDAFNAVQSSPSQNQEAILITGHVLEYENTLYMPYFMLGISPLISKRFSFSTFIKVSPYLKISDVDEHIQRKKRSTGESNGWGLITEINASYFFTSSFAFTVYANYQIVKATGIQKQTFLNSPEPDSSDVILKESISQTNIILGLKYLF